MAFPESECIWLSCIATCFIALMILFPLHCKDVVWGLISFYSTPLYHSLFSYCSALLMRWVCVPCTKPSLMGWKADILFPNEARCIISSAQGLSFEELELSRARPCLCQALERNDCRNSVFGNSAKLANTLRRVGQQIGVVSDKQ